MGTPSGYRTLSPSHAIVNLSTHTSSHSHAERDDRFVREALPWIEQVHRLALALTGDASAAHRLTERTFVCARRNWAELRAHGEARRVLLGVCRNQFAESTASSSLEGAEHGVAERAGDDVRGTGRVFATVLRDGLGDLWGAEAATSALAESFARLPATCRAAVVLIDVDGVPLHDAAAVLGVPEDRLRAWSFRGRRLLQEMLLRHVSAGGRSAHAPGAPVDTRTSLEEGA
jgi:RNA polymerase sigma-70 factor (ECF subfamily)